MTTTGIEGVKTPREIWNMSDRATGVAVDTLGKCEAEAAAMCIVRYHIAKGLTDWTPVPLGDFFEWLPNDGAAKTWNRNPFWRPDFTALHLGGWLEGWEPGNRQSIGRLTDKCLAHLSNPGMWRGKREVHT